jgi:cation diffusion facilitator CzcD-associated flavoprotein CzcO
VFDVSAEERTQIYEKAWDVGGLQFRAGFRDILLDKAANDTAAEFLKNKIKQVVKDPATAAKLADIDHPFSAKRPPIDTGYFETYNRPNVALVDVLADPIAEITPTGLRTGTQSFDLDILVYATGFDAMTGPLLRMDIRGRGDAKLATAWAAGPETYLGLQVAGFPNLFIITGPGSPSVLTNMPVAIEQHVEWITDCIADMRSKGLKRIEPEPQSITQWQADVQKAANATLLPTVKHSWYLGANVPGKPRVFMPYVGGMARYRKICADVAANGYEGFARS